MYQRILLAYDGSETGQQALLECREVAQWSRAAVSLVAVTPLYINMVGVEAGIYDSDLAAEEKEKYTGILNDGLQKLQAAGFQATGEVLLGETVDEIVRYARKIEADLIVVGHRHLDGWAARWWRGSVSKSLIEHAPCSVLVVITH
ncbi:MAG: universal stress protein [Polaromonas sp. 24-62-144]|jgi:nucleotide-binding universal stress UspA family protein|uniref:universal stress protein n=1 Tax=Polaromonas sp. TaxID=1869339 RepID=UPI000BD03903|nr:universal stress protein [Polaromonas sp.]OYY51528.1 MAG: universal stress protein [Polaromonas sp. 35-63-240]OYZ02028.1 MAG: universal stress protein [Polaromonas sp. 28-63-22]OYZ82838.1 MAG: universal stress protein [Polaromonas sp. 24-62-144]HQS30196.1 universal stress protein [Polaromonas sp.]HQS89593.1 universal stress protein [Polaromonas sp.]